jgi:hypothetical protein
VRSRFESYKKSQGVPHELSITKKLKKLQRKLQIARSQSPNVTGKNCAICIQKASIQCETQKALEEAVKLSRILLEELKTK